MDGVSGRTAAVPRFHLLRISRCPRQQGQGREIRQGLLGAAEDVAAAGYEAAMRGRALAITGWRSKQIAAVMKVLPEPVALGMLARQSRSFQSE